ncbi:MAG: YqgE/AlgH family protein [Bosea sp. (in: a-proteobacteria)]
MKMKSSPRSPSRSYLDGQCLIAMPGMRDQRFQRTVVYMCAHSDEGAMGLVINRPAADVKLPELLFQLGIFDSADPIRVGMPEEPVPILRGGPVETGRGFVLHSSDYFADASTLPIDDGVCLTHTVDILKAIAQGEGPRQAVLALGYAGWGAGQLESELQANGWLHCEADAELLFDTDLDTKYRRALAKLGVDPARLSSTAGHG